LAGFFVVFGLAKRSEGGSIGAGLFISSSFERHQRDLQKEPTHAEGVWGFERP
jgi:pantoate kinase